MVGSSVLGNSDEQPNGEIFKGGAKSQEEVWCSWHALYKVNVK